MYLTDSSAKTGSHYYVRKTVGLGPMILEFQVVGAVGTGPTSGIEAANHTSPEAQRQR